MSGKRPPVRIRFKYNIDTGEIEEFIIDDNAVTASEDYHDKVANVVAQHLAHEPHIEDAGPVRSLEGISPQIDVESEMEEQE